MATKLGNSPALIGIEKYRQPGKSTKRKVLPRRFHGESQEIATTKFHNDMCVYRKLMYACRRNLLHGITDATAAMPEDSRSEQMAGVAQWGFLSEGAIFWHRDVSQRLWFNQKVQCRAASTRNNRSTAKSTERGVSEAYSSDVKCAQNQEGQGKSSLKGEGCYRAGVKPMFEPSFGNQTIQFDLNDSPCESQ